MDGTRRPRGVPLRDREPVSRAGARARRARRAAAVVCGPLRQRSARQLLGADDRGHEVSGDHAGSGDQVTLTYGQYRALLETNRQPGGPRHGLPRVPPVYADNQNTYASLYNGVLQRDWFHARARGYESTLDAALHGNNIPTSVVENLIRRHQGRRRAAAAVSPAAPQVLGLDTLPAVRHLRPARRARCRGTRTTTSARGSSIRWRRSAPSISSACAGRSSGRWIDVFENAGKRSGAYSAPVYGTHPYMLLNYNETLDAVFTLAHEMGHSMHTLLSHQAQPFVYAGLHDLRRRGAVDAERGAVPGPDARTCARAASSVPCCCSMRSTASRARSTRR